MITDSVTEQQEAAVQSLLDTHKQPGVSGFLTSPNSFSSFRIAAALGGAARSLSSTSLQGQRSVSTMLQSDVGHSEEQQCQSGKGNRGLLSLREYP